MVSFPDNVVTLNAVGELIKKYMNVKRSCLVFTWMLRAERCGFV